MSHTFIHTHPHPHPHIYIIYTYIHTYIIINVVDAPILGLWLERKNVAKKSRLRATMDKWMRVQLSLSQNPKGVHLK